MKKFYLFLMTGIVSFGTTYSQVGINTQTPLVGLHVVPFSTNGSTAEGIIAPNLTRAQLISKDAKYSATHKGAFVYITAIDGTVTAKTAKITTVGYYYFDGTEWKHFNDKLQNADNGLSVNNATVQLGGTLNKATTIAQGTSQLSITSTNTSASSAILGNNNAVLKLDAANKGFILPRIALKNETDNTTIPISAADKGMLVYHTDNNKMEEGLYSWNGGSWKQLITQIPITPITTKYTRELAKGPTVDWASFKLPQRGKVLQTDRSIIIPEDGTYAFAIRYYVTCSDGAREKATDNEPGVIRTAFPRQGALYFYLRESKAPTTNLDAILTVHSLPDKGSSDFSWVSAGTVILVSDKLKAGDTAQIYVAQNPLRNVAHVFSADPTGVSPSRTSIVFWKL